MYNKQDMPKAATPAEALRQLEEGNARFVHKEPRVQQAADSVHEAIQPFAAIIHCCPAVWDADAIFDQPQRSLLCLDASRDKSWRPICQQLEQRLKAGRVKLIVLLAEENCQHAKTGSPDFSVQKEGLLEQHLLQQEEVLRRTSSLLVAAERNRTCRISSAIYNQKTGRVRFLE
jgi:carbonic anhydrase